MERSGYRGHWVKQTPSTVSLCPVVSEGLGGGVWGVAPPSLGAWGCHSGDMKDAFSSLKPSQLPEMESQKEPRNPAARKFLPRLLTASCPVKLAFWTPDVGGT